MHPENPKQREGFLDFKSKLVIYSFRLDIIALDYRKVYKALKIRKIMVKEKPKVEEQKEEQAVVTEEFGESKTGNPWKFVSIILGISVIVLLVIVFKGGLTGNVVGGQDAAGTLVDYLNTKTGGGVEFDSVKDLGSLYEVVILYEKDEIPVYITKDGKYYVQGVIPIVEEGSVESNTTDVPKSDKPKVEAFVFSYCPYGLQFEKAMAPVYELLKDKADINIVAIGAMHGEFEKVESFRQLCIQKEYGKDKLWSYLKKFAVDTEIGSCDGDKDCLDPLISDLFSQLSISESKINSCMTKDAEALYNADMARAKELGETGSPGFVINGVDVQVARNPEAIKQAICSAFNTAPSVCEETLSTASSSAGFGASASSSSSSATC